MSKYQNNDCHPSTSLGTGAATVERALDWESPRPGCASDSRGQVTHSLCISISSSVNTGDKDDSSLLGGS